jgi:hypothetical protein
MLLAPLLLATLLRLTILGTIYLRTGTGVLAQGDTESYLAPGRNLFLHGSFATDGLPEIDRLPGYPIFAMLTGMLHANVLLTALAQIVLSLGSLLLLKKITDLIFPQRNAGMIAAWLYAIEPLSIVYALRLMPETLFVLLLLLAMERLLSYQLSGRLAVLAEAGLSLAFATYVRPVTYYLGVAVAIAMAIVYRHARGRVWKAPALLLLSIYPLLFAWQMRNFVETGYSGFSSIVEKNLYFFQSAAITADLRHVSLGEQQRELGYENQQSYDRAHPDQRAWTRSEQLHFMRLQSMQIISAHPWLYLRSHLVGVAVVAFTPCAAEPLQLLGLYPARDAMPQRILGEGIAASLYRVIALHPGVAGVMAALESLLLLLYAFAVRGCFVRGANKLGVVTLVAIGLYFLMVSGGAQAVGRYRAPVMPLLCVLAAGGLSFLQRKTLRGHDGPAGEELDAVES